MGNHDKIDVPEDPFRDLLEITFDDISDGSVIARMPVTEKHLNFAGFLHGGAVFTLADAAAGAALESLLDEATSTALEANISFLSTVELGDVVIAKADVTHESSQTAEMSVTLETSEGDHIASCRFRGYKV